MGNPEEGGFQLDKFKERQQAYYDAEHAAIAGSLLALEEADTHFVHDSAGSLCEIENEDLIRKVGEKTLFVYLKTDPEEEKKVLQRAFDHPKPLLFPATFLDEKISEFIAEHGLSTIEDAHPDDFSRWIFPKLFAARKPKYERLADLYGVTIPATEFSDLKSADHFTDIITGHLK